MAETSVQVPTKSLAVWATTTIGEIIPIISAVRASMTISFFDIVSHQYQGPLQMRDFLHEYRAISHAQIELLAARVSALNQCLY